MADKYMFEKHLSTAKYHTEKASYWAKQYSKNGSRPSKLFTKEHIELARYHIARAKEAVPRW